MLSDARWHPIARSEHDHERRALEWLRNALPDEDPVAVWSNFEFVANDGRIYEVDALVITRAGIFLVEIKSWTGTLIAGDLQWDYTSPGGRRRVVDNPRLLANRKARALKSLLEQHWSRDAGRVPFLQPVVWLSEPELGVSFGDRGEHGLVFHTAKNGLPRVDHGLLRGEIPGIACAEPPLNRLQLRALVASLGRLGLRAGDQHRVVNGWVLGELVDEGPRHQDFVGSKDGSKRRVRVFPWAHARTGDERKRLELAARREFRTLEGLRHPNILAVHDCDETERGPAIVFEHPDGFERLDRFLAARAGELSSSQRLDIVATPYKRAQHRQQQCAYTSSCRHGHSWISPNRPPGLA